MYIIVKVTQLHESEDLFCVPDNNRPSMIHKTRESAEEEVRRLINKHGKDKFAVFGYLQTFTRYPDVDRFSPTLVQDNTKVRLKDV